MPYFLIIAGVSMLGLGAFFIIAGIDLILNVVRLIS